MPTQNFVEEKEIEVESLERGKEILQEVFTYDQIDLRLSKLQVGGGYKVRWNGDWHQITEWGFINLLKLHGIPEDFGLRVPPDLTRYNCEQLKSREDKQVRAFLRDEGSVINLVKLPYHTAGSSDILELAESFPYLQSCRVQISDRGINLSLISEKFEELEPKVGDISQIGYELRSSETGGARPQAKVMLYRLACKNGATLPDEWGAVRWPYDRRMRYESCLSKFKRGLSSLGLDQQLLAHRYKGLVNKQVNEDQFIKIWRAGKRVLDSREAADYLLGVDEDRRKEIYREMRKRRKRNKKRLGGEAEPPEPTEFTAYQLFNQITEKAQDYPFVPRQELERLGGRIINLLQE